MKTDVMDMLQHVLAKHSSKGILSWMIYIFIFTCMAGYVVVRSLVHLLTFKKLKLK